MTHHPVLMAGVADTHARSPEVRADLGGNGADAVIAGRPAAVLQPETAGREVNLVIEHDHIAGVSLDEVHRRADRVAGAVVEGLGL